MEYETSYDTGVKPFIHDKNRGKWASPKDFFFACAAHAFKADAIMIMPMVVFEEIGIFALIPYFIILAVCVVPIVFMQSFLGQFSSTGFISVFRIAPLFKGIGYVSLIVNFTTLTYYSVFSAIPLFYFFHSMRPTIPWSCEESAKRLQTTIQLTSICSKNKTDDNLQLIQIPSVEFFRNHIDIATNRHPVEGLTFSLQLMFCALIIWGVITFLILKPTELIGKYIRYSFLAVITIMSLCLVRFIFLPGAIEGLREFFVPDEFRISYDLFIFIPSIALSSLGPGWGSILAMASYNNFKTNIFKYSWIICLAQLGFMVGLTFLTIFIKKFMYTINPDSERFRELYHIQWMEYLSYPTILTFIEWPHFWSLLFFSMWILGSLNILIIQLLSLLNALFDEFENLREIKRKLIFGIIGILAFTSILFCSNSGIYLFQLLSGYSLISQAILNFLLLLVVPWVYGRERFQRDLIFMTSRTYSTWMINIVRFVAPFILFLGLFIGCFFSMQFDNSSSSGIGMISFLFGTLVFLLSWCFIPGYCIIKIKQTTGIIGMRFRRSVRSNDWYPAGPVDRQRYEESLNSAEISHQRTTATVE